MALNHFHIYFNKYFIAIYAQNYAYHFVLLTELILFAFYFILFIIDFNYISTDYNYTQTILLMDETKSRAGAQPRNNTPHPIRILYVF